MKRLIWCLIGLFGLLGFGMARAELVLEPAVPIVEMNKTMVLSVQGAVGNVKWIVGEGKIQGEGTQVTYLAPAQAGLDVVTVLDSEGNTSLVKVVITPPNDFSMENAQWEIFTNRSQINALLLSDDGKALWVGTNGGLEKRDAQTGEIQQIFLNTDGLPDNNIRALLSDGDNGLWVGTSGGLAHRSAAGDWQVFNPENSGLPHNSVHALLSDGDNGLWIGTSDTQGWWGGGLAHRSAAGDWQVFNPENSGLPHNSVHALLSDGDNGLWVGTSGGLAHRSVAGDWQVFNTENSGLPYSSVHALLSDSDNGLWVGFWGGGLAHRSVAGDWQVFNTENSGLPDNVVTALLSDGDNGLWVGTGDTQGWWGGLAHRSAAGDWQVFNPENSGLPYNDIRALLSDGDNGLWVGTDYGGLAHRSSAGDWQVFNPENSGLPYNDIRALLSDGDNGLWVGTGDTRGGGGGLAHRSAAGDWQVFHPAENLFNPLDSGLPYVVDTLLNDGDNGLWVGFWGGGLFHRSAAGDWQVFNTDLPDNVRTLLSDGDNGLWVGFWGGGLAHRSAAGDWQVFNPENSGVPYNVNTLSSDGDNGLWVGTSGGELAHRSAVGDWQVFNQENSGLPGNSINPFNTLLSDGDNGLWVGTGGGGLAHRSAAGDWQVFNQENSGLPSNLIQALLSDGQGGLWVGTGGGLAHLTFGRQTKLCTQAEIDTATCQAIQQGQHAAIIVAAGGAQQSDPLWDNTEAITTRIYRTFYRRGFAKSNVYYLSSKTWADFDSDGINDRINRLTEDRHLTLDDLKTAFAWAKTKGKLDQPLYFFFMDHGGEGKLRLSPDVNVTAEELKALLDDYQNTTGNQLIAVIEACRSGSLIPTLTAPNRAVIASAKDSEYAYFFEKKGFSRFLAEYLLKGASFWESFTLAGRDQDKLRGKNLEFQTAGDTGMGQQTPQLDDNQDGLFTTDDGSWLKQIYINGQFTTADATLTVENQTPATTLTVGQPITLQAKVTLTQGTVQRVWAVIRPPTIAQVLDTNGTPILAFPRLNLGQSAENPELWQATWQEAVYNGNYLITFYAQDNEKNIVSSEQDTVVTVSGGIDPPSQAQVQIHLEKDRYQRGEPFKATLTEDLGWGYDLYAAVVLPDGNFIALNGTNNLRPVNEAKPWYAPRKPGNAITLFDLTLPADLPTGQYCLYGILSPEQNDVFETKEKGLWVYGSQCFEITL